MLSINSFENRIHRDRERQLLRPASRLSGSIRRPKPIGHNIRLTEHNWDPQLNSPDRRCPCDPTDTFIGDYFGNEFAGATDYATFVSTYDDGSNPAHYQQQVVATISLPKR